MKNLIAFLLLLFISQLAVAQQIKLDSIQKLYHIPTVDTLKIKYTYQLAELNAAKPEVAIPYENEGLQLAERLNRLYDMAYGKGMPRNCTMAF